MRRLRPNAATLSVQPARIVLEKRAPVLNQPRALSKLQLHIFSRRLAFTSPTHISHAVSYSDGYSHHHVTGDCSNV
jgi:hypothetical protein